MICLNILVYSSQLPILQTALIQFLSLSPFRISPLLNQFLPTDIETKVFTCEYSTKLPSWQLSGTFQRQSFCSYMTKVQSILPKMQMFLGVFYCFIALLSLSSVKNILKSIILMIIRLINATFYKLHSAEMFLKVCETQLTFSYSFVNKALLIEKLPCLHITYRNLAIYLFPMLLLKTVNKSLSITLIIFFESYIFCSPTSRLSPCSTSNKMSLFEYSTSAKYFKLYQIISLRIMRQLGNLSNTFKDRFCLTSLIFLQKRCKNNMKRMALPHFRHFDIR